MMMLFFFFSMGYTLIKGFVWVMNKFFNTHLTVSTDSSHRIYLKNLCIHSKRCPVVFPNVLLHIESICFDFFSKENTRKSIVVSSLSLGIYDSHGKTLWNFFPSGKTLTTYNKHLCTPCDAPRINSFNDGDENTRKLSFINGVQMLIKKKVTVLLRSLLHPLLNHLLTLYHLFLSDLMENTSETKPETMETDAKLLSFLKYFVARLIHIILYCFKQLVIRFTHVKISLKAKHSYGLYSTQDLHIDHLVLDMLSSPSKPNQPHFHLMTHLSAIQFYHHYDFSYLPFFSLHKQFQPMQSTRIASLPDIAVMISVNLFRPLHDFSSTTSDFFHLYTFNVLLSSLCMTFSDTFLLDGVSLYFTQKHRRPFHVSQPSTDPWVNFVKHSLLEVPLGLKLNLFVTEQVDVCYQYATTHGLSQVLDSLTPEIPKNIAWKSHENGSSGMDHIKPCVNVSLKGLTTEYYVVLNDLQRIANSTKSINFYQLDQETLFLMSFHGLTAMFGDEILSFQVSGTMGFTSDALSSGQTMYITNLNPISSFPQSPFQCLPNYKQETFPRSLYDKNDPTLPRSVMITVSKTLNTLALSPTFCHKSYAIPVKVSVVLDQLSIHLSSLMTLLEFIREIQHHIENWHQRIVQLEKMLDKFYFETSPLCFGGPFTGNLDPMKTKMGFWTPTDVDLVFHKISIDVKTHGQENYHSSHTKDSQRKAVPFDALGISVTCEPCVLRLTCRDPMARMESFYKIFFSLSQCSMNVYLQEYHTLLTSSVSLSPTRMCPIIFPMTLEITLSLFHKKTQPSCYRIKADVKFDSFNVIVHEAVLKRLAHLLSCSSPSSTSVVLFSDQRLYRTSNCSFPWSDPSQRNSGTKEPQSAIPCPTCQYFNKDLHLFSSVRSSPDTTKCFYQDSSAHKTNHKIGSTLNVSPNRFNTWSCGGLFSPLSTQKSFHQWLQDHSVHLTFSIQRLTLGFIQGSLHQVPSEFDLRKRSTTKNKGIHLNCSQIHCGFKSSQSSFHLNEPPNIPWSPQFHIRVGYMAAVWIPYVDQNPLTTSSYSFAMDENYGAGTSYFTEDGKPFIHRSYSSDSTFNPHQPFLLFKLFPFGFSLDSPENSSNSCPPEIQELNTRTFNETDACIVSGRIDVSRRNMEDFRVKIHIQCSVKQFQGHLHPISTCLLDFFHTVYLKPLKRIVKSISKQISPMPVSLNSQRKVFSTENERQDKKTSATTTLIVFCLSFNVRQCLIHIFSGESSAPLSKEVNSPNSNVDCRKEKTSSVQESAMSSMKFTKMSGVFQSTISQSLDHKRMASQLESWRDCWDFGLMPFSFKFILGQYHCIFSRESSEKNHLEKNSNGLSLALHSFQKQEALYFHISYLLPLSQLDYTKTPTTRQNKKNRFTQLWCDVYISTLVFSLDPFALLDLNQMIHAWTLWIGHRRTRRETHRLSPLLVQATEKHCRPHGKTMQCIKSIPCGTFGTTPFFTSFHESRVKKIFASCLCDSLTVQLYHPTAMMTWSMLRSRCTWKKSSVYPRVLDAYQDQRPISCSFPSGEDSNCTLLTQHVSGLFHEALLTIQPLSKPFVKDSNHVLLFISKALLQYTLIRPDFSFSTAPKDETQRVNPSASHAQRVCRSLLVQLDTYTRSDEGEPLVTYGCLFHLSNVSLGQSVEILADVARCIRWLTWWGPPLKESFQKDALGTTGRPCSCAVCQESSSIHNGTLQLIIPGLLFYISQDTPQKTKIHQKNFCWCMQDLSAHLKLLNHAIETCSVSAKSLCCYYNQREPLCVIPFVSLVPSTFVEWNCRSDSVLYHTRWINTTHTCYDKQEGMHVEKDKLAHKLFPFFACPLEENNADTGMNEENHVLVTREVLTDLGNSHGSNVIVSTAKVTTPPGLMINYKSTVIRSESKSFVTLRIHCPSHFQLVAFPEVLLTGFHYLNCFTECLQHDDLFFSNTSRRHSSDQTFPFHSSGEWSRVLMSIKYPPQFIDQPSQLIHDSDPPDPSLSSFHEWCTETGSPRYGNESRQRTCALPLQNDPYAHSSPVDHYLSTSIHGEMHLSCLSIVFVEQLKLRVHPGEKSYGTCSPLYSFCFTTCVKLTHQSDGPTKRPRLSEYFSFPLSGSTHVKLVDTNLYVGQLGYPLVKGKKQKQDSCCPISVPTKDMLVTTLFQSALQDVEDDLISALHIYTLPLSTNTTKHMTTCEANCQTAEQQVLETVNFNDSLQEMLGEVYFGQDHVLMGSFSASQFQDLSMCNLCTHPLQVEAHLSFNDSGDSITSPSFSDALKEIRLTVEMKKIDLRCSDADLKAFNTLQDNVIYLLHNLPSLKVFRPDVKTLHPNAASSNTLVLRLHENWNVKILIRHLHEMKLTFQDSLTLPLVQIKLTHLRIETKQTILRHSLEDSKMSQSVSIFIEQIQANVQRKMEKYSPSTSHLKAWCPSVSCTKDPSPCQSYLLETQSSLHQLIGNFPLSFEAVTFISSDGQRNGQLSLNVSETVNISVQPHILASCFDFVSARQLFLKNDLPTYCIAIDSSPFYASFYRKLLGIVSKRKILLSPDPPETSVAILQTLEKRWSKLRPTQSRSASDRFPFTFVFQDLRQLGLSFNSRMFERQYSLKNETLHSIHYTLTGHGAIVTLPSQTQLITLTPPQLLLNEREPQRDLTYFEPFLPTSSGVKSPQMNLTMIQRTFRIKQASLFITNHLDLSLDVIFYLKGDTPKENTYPRSLRILVDPKTTVDASPLVSTTWWSIALEVLYNSTPIKTNSCLFDHLLHRSIRVTSTTPGFPFQAILNMLCPKQKNLMSSEAGTYLDFWGFALQILPPMKICNILPRSVYCFLQQNGTTRMLHLEPFQNTSVPESFSESPLLECLMNFSETESSLHTNDKVVLVLPDSFLSSSFTHDECFCEIHQYHKTLEYDSNEQTQHTLDYASPPHSLLEKGKRNEGSKVISSLGITVVWEFNQLFLKLTLCTYVCVINFTQEALQYMPRVYKEDHRELQTTTVTPVTWFSKNQNLSSDLFDYYSIPLSPHPCYSFPFSWAEPDAPLLSTAGNNHLKEIPYTKNHYDMFQEDHLRKILWTYQAPTTQTPENKSIVHPFFFPLYHKEFRVTRNNETLYVVHTLPDVTDTSSSKIELHSFELFHFQDGIAITFQCYTIQTENVKMLLLLFLPTHLVNNQSPYRLCVRQRLGHLTHKTKYKVTALQHSSIRQLYWGSSSSTLPFTFQLCHITRQIYTPWLPMVSPSSPSGLELHYCLLCLPSRSSLPSDSSPGERNIPDGRHQVIALLSTTRQGVVLITLVTPWTVLSRQPTPLCVPPAVVFRNELSIPLYLRTIYPSLYKSYRTRLSPVASTQYFLQGLYEKRSSSFLLSCASQFHFVPKRKDTYTLMDMVDTTSPEDPSGNNKASAMICLTNNTPILFHQADQTSGTLSLYCIHQETQQPFLCRYTWHLVLLSEGTIPILCIRGTYTLFKLVLASPFASYSTWFSHTLSYICPLNGFKYWAIAASEWRLDSTGDSIPEFNDHLLYSSSPPLQSLENSRHSPEGWIHPKTYDAIHFIHNILTSHLDVSKFHVFIKGIFLSVSESFFRQPFIPLDHQNSPTEMFVDAPTFELHISFSHLEVERKISPVPMSKGESSKNFSYMVHCDSLDVSQGCLNDSNLPLFPLPSSSLETFSLFQDTESGKKITWSVSLFSGEVVARKHFYHDGLEKKDAQLVFTPWCKNKVERKEKSQEDVELSKDIQRTHDPAYTRTNTSLQGSDASHPSLSHLEDSQVQLHVSKDDPSLPSLYMSWTYPVPPNLLTSCHRKESFSTTPEHNKGCRVLISTDLGQRQPLVGDPVNVVDHISLFGPLGVKSFFVPLQFDDVKIQLCPTKIRYNFPWIAQLWQNGLLYTQQLQRRFSVCNNRKNSSLGLCLTTQTRDPSDKENIKNLLQHFGLISPDNLFTLPIRWNTWSSCCIKKAHIHPITLRLTVTQLTHFVDIKNLELAWPERVVYHEQISFHSDAHIRAIKDAVLRQLLERWTHTLSSIDLPGRPVERVKEVYQWLRLVFGRATLDFHDAKMPFGSCLPDKTK